MTYGMFVQRCVCIVMRRNRTAIGKQQGEKTSFALSPVKRSFLFYTVMKVPHKTSPHLSVFLLFLLKSLDGNVVFTTCRSRFYSSAHRDRMTLQ